MGSFHWCALAAGSIARELNKFEDKEFVKTLAYAMFEAANKLIKETK